MPKRPRCATFKCCTLDPAEDIMSRKCAICGKHPHVGHNVSHAHNVTKRRWFPNLQRVRVVIDGTPKKILVCASCIKSGAIDQYRKKS